jgi:hypothetical protein
MSDSQTMKRVRRRSLAVQLESALRDAEAAATADISTQKLIQTRLNILGKALTRERNNKLKKALAEVTRLTAEVERLKQELTAKPAIQPMSDIDRVLAHEAEKAGKNLASGETPSKTALDDEIAKKLQRIKNGGSETETQPVASMPVGPLPEEIADQERERIADLEEKSRQQELKRKRDALDYAERMAAVDRENAELDEKLSKLGSKYYTPSTTSALL